MTTYAADAAQVGERTSLSAVFVGDPVLVPEIAAPSVPDWAVQRPRIISQIAEAVRWCQLTVVTGPAGAGKTMAVASWAARQPGPVAWVSLQEPDNQAEVFWPHVAAALGKSGVAVPGVVPAAGQARAGDHVFLLRPAAALAGQDPPVTLILDDLHLVTDRLVLSGLDYVLRNAGSGLRLVVCSRADPPLPLHRYLLAGQLAPDRAGDLAFSTAEAGMLLARHGCMLPENSLERLRVRTEGWAAGLGLAAISIGPHPDPDRFLGELITPDSALTGYLADEVLNTQPPQVRDVLLCTSVLDRVSAEAAIDLAGTEQAPGILAGLVRANAFIQPDGPGWYRYHPLFATVLRLTLRRERPDRVTGLYRQAARWHARHGLLPDAVQYAARAGDWRLAAGMVIEDLAIGQILQPADGQVPAGAFAGMPSGRAWTEPAPYLVGAAASLSAGRASACAAALDAAEALLKRRPADREPECRLAAALIRLAASLRSGDLTAAAAAAASAEVLIGQVPASKLDRHPDIRARVICGRGAVELWSGHLDEAARILRAGTAAQAGLAGEDEPAKGVGHLALVEALRGRLRCAAELAAQTIAPAAGAACPARDPDPAALAALAWVHLQRTELRQARVRLRQADTALNAAPDQLIEAVGYLVAAGGALAEGRAAVARQIIARARLRCPVPAWLDHQLSLLQSRAHAAAGDARAALAAAERAGGDHQPETAVTLAHAWAAAGDRDTARKVLAPALAAGSDVPGSVRVQACLIDARLSYAGGNQARGRRSLAAALRLAQPEQLRLPFAAEHGWLAPLLRHDPELAATCRRLHASPPPSAQVPKRRGAPKQPGILAMGIVTEREREVLGHLSDVLTNEEIATEMRISVNTVKTHIKNIYNKLAVANRHDAVRRARGLQMILRSCTEVVRCARPAMMAGACRSLYAPDALQ